MCGENAATTQAVVLPVGSSPRVRGKPSKPPPSVAGRGLIPACAGKTNTFKLAAIVTQAHPRVCGENSMSIMRVRTPAGSSPRVRGKRSRRTCGHGRRGLIPACAGKTKMVADLNTRLGAHPRVCGENTGDVTGELSGTGSSPRVRGKQSIIQLLRRSSRLIPACAGKTTFARSVA